MEGGEAEASSLFWCFEQGQVRRAIDYGDGKLTKRGEPLPQEVGIVQEVFYVAEAEALWKALGMFAPDQFPPAREFEAISVRDNTDYDVLSSDKPKKPWWRFWCA